MNGMTHQILLALELLAQLEQRGQVIVADEPMEIRAAPKLEIPRGLYPRDDRARENRGGYAVVPERYHRRRK
jgi:hypothetical protein